MATVPYARIATRGGDYFATAYAEVGPFVVHSSWGCIDGWTLTHGATGWAVATSIPTPEKAVQLGQELMDMADWSFSHANAVHRWTRYRRRKVVGHIRQFQKLAKESQ